MGIRYLLSAIIILLAARVIAQPELLPPTAPERVPLIVAALNPERPETLIEVETRLAAMGKPGLRTVSQYYSRSQVELRRAEQQQRWYDVWQLTARVQVFGQALLRIQTGRHPRELIQAWLRNAGQDAALPPLVLLRDPDLDRAFPRHAVYLARPPAPADPKDGAPPSRLFAVARDGAVTPLGNAAEMRQFFLTHLPPLPTLEARLKRTAKNTEEDAHASLRETSLCALRVWMRLSQHLHGDGYFRFTALQAAETTQPAAAGKDSPTWLATGRVDAARDAGDRGEIRVTLEFRTAKYRLADVRETVELQPGPRPDDLLEQFLDPDPAVRQTAEQRLLRMGPPALDHLAARRALARPALRDAIDAFWRRIAPPADAR